MSGWVDPPFFFFFRAAFDFFSPDPGLLLFDPPKIRGDFHNWGVQRSSRGSEKENPRAPEFVTACHVMLSHNQNPGR